MSRLLPFILATGALTTVAIASSETVFDSFRQANRADFVIPAPADSTIGPDNKFDAASLLTARRAARAAEAAGWTTMVPDSAGNLTLVQPSDGASLNTVYTRIRPSRFVKGQLKLNSNVRAEVLVDGKQVIKKESADSLPSPSTANLQFKPEQSADIQVNILSLSDDAAAPVVSLSFVPDDEYSDVEIHQGPDLRDRMRVETVTLGARVTGISMSPDGKYYISRYSENYDSEKNRSWATLRETASGRLLNADLPASADWMPNGATLRYFESADDTWELWTIDPASGKRTLLARNLPDNNLEFAPDGSFAVYYKQVEGTKDDGIMRRVQSPDDRQPGNRDRLYMVKYDFKTGVSAPLSYGGASTYLLEISPDSKKVLYRNVKETPSKWPFYFSDIIEMDVNTLKADTLLRDITALSTAVYSPDGRQLFITGGPSCFDNLGKNCGDHPIANDFDYQGYIFDIKSGGIKAVTRDFNPSIQGTPIWNRADGNIYFSVEEGFFSNVYSFDPRKSVFKKIPVSVDYVRSFSIGSNESRWITAVGMGANYVGRSVLLDLKSGKSTVIDDPMAEMTSNIEFGKTEPWKFVSRDGTEIDGLITLPPDFDPEKKYPLIVYYYGGTAPSSVGMNSPYSYEVFASRDYVVYTLNPSGTPGYGQEFSARHVNAWGDYTADDIIEGVKKFCDAHPFVNRDKIGCIGASYGGFMTQLLLTKTDIFSAAVSHAGISNVASYWGEGYWGYSYNAVAAAKEYPWTNPDLFTKHGSLFNADKIHTPLLLLHGTVDTNVPIGESIQLFNALRILDRDVEFVTVEDANHVVTDYNKRKVWQATIMAWFARWLQDDPRWWNELY